MPRTAALAALCLAACACDRSPESAALGQGPEPFRLFNACRPMELAVDGLDDDAAIGLTKEALQAAAESRMRAARLYTEDPAKSDSAYLHVEVRVVGPAFSIVVTYHKRVTDGFGRPGLAATWRTGSGGTHGGDEGFVAQGLSGHLDRFLAADLRVNGEACEGPRAVW